MDRDDIPQHTPGPWRTSSAAMDGFSPIMASGGVIVALVSTLSANAKANARLIATAPELLEVARDMLPANICLTNPNVRDDVVIPLDVTMGELRKIAAVVAKAQGSTHD